MSGENNLSRSSRMISDAVDLFGLVDRVARKVTVRQADMLLDLIYDMNEDEAEQTAGVIIYLFYRDQESFGKMKFPEMFFGYLCENATKLSKVENPKFCKRKKLILEFLVDCARLPEFSPFVPTINKAIARLNASGVSP